jgi:UDP-N-acetyl-D-mannosaminuronic acid dehydrogenase
MPLSFRDESDFDWKVRKICVVGPGIVGMPMAALLADAEIKEGSDDPAHVVVIQRDSPTSGWKVEAINAGRSVIGGVEPALDEIVSAAVDAGTLSASHDYGVASDADLILVCVQTDKKGLEPDYDPLFACLEELAGALANRPGDNIPVVVFESTLAPSTMTTMIRSFFAERGLVEGRDLLLGNSPNRVMPGRLVERVASSDKLVAGLHPLTPELIRRVYARIVTDGTLHPTNSMTAEVVKTLENAYRDVRIGLAAELVRYCDSRDIDFFALRDKINERLLRSDEASGSATAIPSGALLVPTIGVGGHCLPKDGILLWWRRIASGSDTADSLILKARTINDESPAHTVALAEAAFGSLRGRTVALLGTAYRFDSEDTRNSPTLDLAELLDGLGADVRLQDPYVKPTDQNLLRRNLDGRFTNDLDEALDGAELAVICTGHEVYAAAGPNDLTRRGKRLAGIVDGANLFRRSEVEAEGLGYTGIGRGRRTPEDKLVEFTEDTFRVVEHGVANEVAAIVTFLNESFAADDFNRVSFDEVRRLAATCSTGCDIAAVRSNLRAPVLEGFSSRLATCAERASKEAGMRLGT